MKPRMLIELKKLLEEHPFSISQRGDENARFLFVKSEVRSGEVSLHDGEFWIELWESADEEADDEPVEQISCGTADDAYKLLISWLQG
ncbi:MAG: hypothetical protein ACYS8Z_24700 [Planctomycetota bacterium]